MGSRLSGSADTSHASIHSNTCLELNFHTFIISSLQGIPLLSQELHHVLKTKRNTVILNMISWEREIFILKYSIPWPDFSVTYMFSTEHTAPISDILAQLRFYQNFENNVF